ncbi:branched-chain amino acid ABC transporter substrate-binding protein [Archaeoglobales archaeon]|nr:MAG: branched-chain amino acid ABC transporter substrate-binding protein [Archaeoglobales archaeon]
MKKVVVLLIVSLLILGCVQQKPTTTPTPTSTVTPTQPKETKIGVLIPKTGKFSNAGVYMENAAKLAEKHIKELDIAKDYSIKLVFADCGDDPNTAKSAFLNLANQGVVAVVGAYTSPQAVACADAASQTKVVYIASVASTGQLEQKVKDGNKYVFRNAYNTTYWGVLAAKFLKISNAEAYYFQGFSPLKTFNQGMLNAIKQQVNLTLKGEEYYNPKVNPKDVEDSAVKAANVVGEKDVLILGDPGSLSIKFLKVYRQNGGKGIVYSVGGTLALPQVLASISDSNYTAFQAAVLKETEKTEYTSKYFNDYKALYGEEANNYAGVLTYDAILILAQALEKGDTDLIKALEESEFTGACGIYKFNELHQAEWGSEKLKGIIGEWVGKVEVIYPPEFKTSDVAWK